MRDTTHILMEGAPRGVILADVRNAIEALNGVAGVHDLHVWISGADQPSCTVHLVLSADARPEPVRQAVTTLLEQRFEIHHSTVQAETAPSGDLEDGHR